MGGPVSEKTAACLANSECLLLWKHINLKFVTCSVNSYCIINSYHLQELLIKALQKFWYQAMSAYQIETKNADLVRNQQWKEREFTVEAWIQVEEREGSISPGPSHGKSDIWSEPEYELVNGKWEKVTSRRVAHPTLREVVHMIWVTPQCCYLVLGSCRGGPGCWLWWNTKLSHG